MILEGEEEPYLRRTELFFGLIFLTMFSLSLLPVIASASPDGYSWLVGWSYRKSLVVNSASGAGTGYQVKIVAYYGSGTDTGSDIYCGGNCRMDFGDIRFTDNDGITLLDYWMEKKTDSDKATFWVEIADDLSSSDATIYVYYGNLAASTTSDGDATFLFFDSYDDNSLDVSKWNWQLDSNNASNVHLAEKNQRMESWKDVGSGVSGANYRESDDSWPLERIVEFELYVDYDQTSTGGYAHAWTVWQQDDNNKLSCTHASYNSTHFRIILEKVEGGSHTPGEWGYFSWDTWYYVRTRIDSTSIVLEIFSGGFDETIEHVAYLSHTRTGNGRLHNRIASSSLMSSGFGYFDDDFRIRKYTYPEPSYGGWGSEESNWLAGWSHRKSHVINPASGSGTNYQVKIVVHYGPGIDNNENAYFNSQCRTDFGDIRFTDDDGVTELDYWIEEKVDSNYGVFWVEIRDDLNTASATIFVYYGNSAATTTSNGENTFIFFEDFSNGLNASKWYSEGNISVTGGECTIGGSTTYSKIRTLDVYGTGHAGRARSKATADYSWLVDFGEGEGGGDWLVIRRWQFYAGPDFYHAVQDGDGSHRSTQPSTNVDANYHTSEIRWISGSLAYTDIDGTVVTFSTANVPDGDYRKNLCFKAFGDLETGTRTVVDWCLVRKCVDPEPSHGTWGGEGQPQDSQQGLIVVIVAVAIGGVVTFGIAMSLKARSPRAEPLAPEPRGPVSELTYEEEILPEETAPEIEEGEEPEPISPSEILCSHCGHVNPAGSKFCIRCGQHLQ